MIRVRPAKEPPDFDANVRQPGLRAVAELAGVDRLRLNGPVCCEARREYAEDDYWHRCITLDYLTRHSPFVARELRRQERLREDDAD